MRNRTLPQSHQHHQHHQHHHLNHANNNTHHTQSATAGIPRADLMEDGKVHPLLDVESGHHHGHGHASGEWSSPPRTLRTLALVSVTFFCTAGGPYGLESILSASGPLYCLSALLLFPWFWSFPIAMATAELASIIPASEGIGYVVWIERAFGKFCSFQASYWSCVCNLLDKALYPVLFMDYLDVMLEGQGGLSGTARFFISAVLIVFVVYLNLRGMEIVGTMSLVFFAATMLPFVVFFVLSLPRLDVSLLLDRGNPLQADWSLFISLLIWNNSGWDSVGFLAAETVNPKRTFPRAMVIAIILVSSTYTLPLMAAICVDQSWGEWKNGTFQLLAATVGGQWLTILFVVGAAFCCIGIFNALLSTTSRLMFSMAQLRMLPSIFASIHPKWGTPWFAVVFNGLVIAGCTFLPFKELLEASVVTNGVVIGAILASFLVIRFKNLGNANVKESEVFRLPVSTPVLCVCFLPPLALCFYSIAWANPSAHMVTLFLLCTGTLLYGYFQAIQDPSMCPFRLPAWMVGKTPVMLAGLSSSTIGGGSSTGSASMLSASQQLEEVLEREREKERERIERSARAQQDVIN
eukprot:TRINITY_DN3771_c1_g1_i2.p1 TRINITY_DN3771_c1_g1~~TRINITY_DN3771_c1_g1_i2.p1  ORF type:complete len:579 (-),score=79.20 TRINITY_DN3771_c1_g1_i2:164-1900(-)